jgi:hypothetical protein
MWTPRVPVRLEIATSQVWRVRRHPVTSVIPIVRQDLRLAPILAGCRGRMVRIPSDNPARKLGPRARNSTAVVGMAG